MVVVLPPSLDLSPRVAETCEPVGIQTFIAQAAVESLGIGILHWLARLDEFQAPPSLLAPGSQGATPELGPVIQNNRLRQPSLTHDPIQHSPHSQSAQGSVDFDAGTFPRVIVQDGQQANHFSPTYAVAHK